MLEIGAYIRLLSQILIQIKSQGNEFVKTWRNPGYGYIVFLTAFCLIKLIVVVVAVLLI